MAPRVEGMDQQVTDLDVDRVASIDKWVDDQWANKNLSLTYDENSVGLHILNRGPLDPLAFTIGAGIYLRGMRLKEALARDSLRDPIIPAHIILLIADPDEMATRAIASGKTYNANVLRKQEDTLREVYGNTTAVTVIDTRGLTIQQTVRQIARVVHLEVYIELNISRQLDSILKNTQVPFNF